MAAPKRIGLVSNGLGGWRLWSTDEPDTGGCDYPGAEYILATDHARIVAEKDAEIARLRAAARDVVLAYLEANPMRTADMHPASCGCLRCEIDRLDYVAGS